MAGAYVDGWGANNGNGADASITVTISTTPTVNNLLVCAATAHVNNDGTWNTPTDFTLVHNVVNSTLGVTGIMAYKVSEGDEASVVASIATGTRRLSAIVAEYSGLATTSPLEDSDEDETNIATAVATQDTGTITPVTANGMAIVSVSARGQANITTPTIDESFTIDLSEGEIGSYPYTALASKAYTSTAALSPTWTKGASNFYGYGISAAFKEPAAGGGPVFVPKVMMF